jgi:CRP-like cAMP-binding protein
MGRALQVPVKRGDWVIRQGEEGDRFYIIDEGSFEVRVASDEAGIRNGGGNVVHTYQASASDGHEP